MPSALSYSRQEMRHRYPEEHREIYHKLLGEARDSDIKLNTRIRNQLYSRAITAIIQRYKTEYTTLYQETLDSGYTQSNGMHRKSKIRWEIKVTGKEVYVVYRRKVVLATDDIEIALKYISDFHKEHRQ